MDLYGQKFDLKNPQNTFFHGDCLEGMKQFPDGYFDLAVVDPPYGDGVGGQQTNSVNDSTATNNQNRFGGWFNKYKQAGQSRMGGRFARYNRDSHSRRNMGEEIQKDGDYP